MDVPVHRVPIYHDLTNDFASAKHTLVIVINLSLITEIIRGLDALSVYVHCNLRLRHMYPFSFNYIHSQLAASLFFNLKMLSSVLLKGWLKVA